MFLLVLSVCLRILSGAGSSDEASSADSTIELYELYAGNLIYSNYEDGSCIACKGACNETSAVPPHSWTAVLNYNNSKGEIVYEDVDRCRAYAADVAEFGVKAFTWNKRTKECSLHVLAETTDIGLEMWVHNRFEWKHEHVENTGPLFLVRYPSKRVEADAVCYYGLNINNTPNIARETNILIIITVVIIIISWNVWMNHTENYPPFFGEGHVPTDSSDDGQEKHNIYRDDSKEK